MQHTDIMCVYRISLNKSPCRIIAGLIYTPGGSWPLKVINARPRIHAGSNCLEAWHVAHVGYSASHVKAQVVLRFF